MFNSFSYEFINPQYFYLSFSRKTKTNEEGKECEIIENKF